MAKSLKSYAATVSAFVFTFLIFFFSAASYAQAASKAALTKASSEQQQIGQLTAELNQMLSSYRHASPDEQTLIEQQLNSIATQRQQLLVEVVESDPKAVLKYALPNKVQQQFPQQVQEKFEQWIHAQGEFEIYFEDHERHDNSRLRYYLKQDNRRFALSVAGNTLPVQTSGHSVRVQGVLVPGTGKPVIATNDEQIMLAAGGTGDPVTTGSTAALSNTLGQQRTAVFLVNFQDDPANKPWSVQQTHDRFFNEINGFFLETSYQQTWLAGDVLGWYTLPINSTGCGQTDIADAADSMASANGVDLSQYDRYVYVFPQNACTWSGFAMVGGSPSRAWVNDDLYGKTPAHEIGHNFGLYHSHGLNCEGDATETNCKSITYGDQMDTMGARPGHFNAFQKERLGWLNQDGTPPIVTVNQEGSYAVELLETTSSNAKALKVFKDTDPYTGTSRWYYIELRQPVGADQFIETSNYLVADNITNGVTFHLGTEDSGNSSYLLDMTPESPTLFSGDSADLFDPALTTGNSYTDSAAGVTITTEYTDSQKATVYVSYDGSGPAPCSHANPLVAVNPVESQWVSAGTQVDFTVSVTNQDSSNCAPVTYNVQAAVPLGWDANNPQLTVSPSETSTAVVSVSSASDATTDFYEIILTGSNIDNSSLSASVTATYVVSNGSVNNAPDARNDDVTMAIVEPIVIDVLSNDSDADADAIYISAIGNATKGDVSVNSDGLVLYTPAKRFKDNDSFAYTISDGQASDTATVNLTLQSSGGDSDSVKGGGNGGGKGGGKPTK